MALPTRTTRSVFLTDAGRRVVSRARGDGPAPGITSHHGPYCTETVFDASIVTEHWDLSAETVAQPVHDCT